MVLQTHYKLKRSKKHDAAIEAAANERLSAGLYNRECSNLALEHIQGTNEEIKT